MNLLCLTCGDGSNRTFEKLVRTLAPGAARVEVLAWDRARRYAPTAVRDGIPYRFLRRGGGFRNRHLAYGRVIWMLQLLWHLLRQRPTLIWAANFETALPAAIAGTFTCVPFIYYIHDNISISHRFPWWLRQLLEALDGWVIRRAARTIVPDENRILPYAEALANRFQVLPNTPTLALAPAIGEKDREAPFTIYATGSLWSSRGIRELMEASAGVSGLRLLVAGRAPQPAIAQALAMAPQVDYRGDLSHAEALRLYREADLVFAFYEPSIDVNIRASPTKLYEAMMMGTAVLVNSEAKISAKVQAWGIGYTSPYPDVTALRNLLLRLRSQRMEVWDCGRRARALFQAQYTWERFQPKLLEIVKEVLAQTAGADSAGGFCDRHTQSQHPVSVSKAEPITSRSEAEQ